MCRSPYGIQRLGENGRNEEPVGSFSPADWITVVFLVGFAKWKRIQDWNRAGNQRRKDLAKGRLLGHVNWTDDSTKSWEPRKAEGGDSKALCQKLEGKRGEKRGRNRDVLQRRSEKATDKRRGLASSKETTQKKERPVNRFEGRGNNDREDESNTI